MMAFQIVADAPYGSLEVAHKTSAQNCSGYGTRTRYVVRLPRTISSRLIFGPVNRSNLVIRVVSLRTIFGVQLVF